MLSSTPPLIALLSLVLLLPSALSQSAGQTTWGSVVFTYQGESQPSIAYNPPVLTEVGAQQAYSAATAIRTRYISGNGSDVTQTFPIIGLSRHIIDNSQLYIASPDDDINVHNAMAFMQGLYPPLMVAQNDEGSFLSDGSVVQNPLNGYQYPTLETLGINDFNAISLAGDSFCQQKQLSAQSYPYSTSFRTIYSGTYAFYQSLIPTVFHNLQYTQNISFATAVGLYDYAAYMYKHNVTVRQALSSSNLAVLHNLASQYAFAINGNLSSSGLVQGDQIRAVAGKTLASKVVQLLSMSTRTLGNKYKLSLLFGDMEPFLSFFALSSLSTHSPTFQTLPLPGSVMIFELFSNPSNNTEDVVYPSDKNLWVRFLFRNGTSNDADIISYPLFGRGNSKTDMMWSEFQTGMRAIGISEVGDWCKTCGTSNTWCGTFVDNSSSTSPSSSSSSASTGITPQVAGVIGAAVTITLAILIVAAAVVFGGFRFVKRESRRGSGGSGLGGFKGAEKLKSDTDVNVIQSDHDGVVKGGSGGHERTGSWELKDGIKGGVTRVGDDNSSAGLKRPEERVVSGADYGRGWDEERDADIDAHAASPFADPVKIDDRI